MGGRGYRKLNKFKPFDSNTICDETGFKKKMSEVQKRWDGFYVIPEAWNPQQPQDFPPTISKPIVHPSSRSESSYPPLYVEEVDVDALTTAWTDAGITSAWLMNDSELPLEPVIGDNPLTGGGVLLFNQNLGGINRNGVSLNRDTGASYIDGDEADFDTKGDSFSFIGLIEPTTSASAVQRLCIVLGSLGVGFNFYIESGVFVFQNLGMSPITRTSSLNVFLDTVQKVACVMDGANGTVDIYVDDQHEQFTGLTIDGDYGTLIAAKLGSQDGIGNFQFYGKMSCCGVKRGVLTSDQVSSIFSVLG